MKNWKIFPRTFLFILLIAGLCAGMVVPRLDTVKAAPKVLPATTVVISEFRTLGTDEFIEIYNPTNSTVSIAGFKLRRSSSCAGALNDIYEFPSGLNLLPGQYYLVAGLNYSGSVTPDIRLSGSMSIADTGGIAITDAANTPIDQVGMCSTTTYKEGTALAGLATAGHSYERKNGGPNDSCLDDSNNATDFLDISSNPQNASTLRSLCGVLFTSDISIAQSVSNSTTNTGAIFSITVTNNGPDDASNVEVTDALPAGLNYVAPYTTTKGTYNNGTGKWTVGTLANGSSATLKIMATVTTSGVTNTAAISHSDQFDPDSTPASNSASVTVNSPSGTVDLEVTQLPANNSSPNIGESVVFTVTVKNNGTDTATNVHVKDTLASGLTYVSDNGASGSYISSLGIWQVGTLINGESRTLKITAIVGATDPYTNTAEVFSLDQAETNIGNNSAFVTVNPGGGIANLQLTQTYDKASPAIAGHVVLTISVKNLVGVGLYNATNVIVKDDLPAGLTYVSDNSGGAYNKDTGMWSAGAIANGATKSLKITVKVDETGSMTNWAEVWSADQAPSDSRVYGNDSTSEDDDDDVTVLSADLSLTKSMDNVTPTVGTDVVFTIRVTNSGPDAATGVVVKDKLTASYTYVSDDSSGTSTYNETTGDWTLGLALAPGTSQTLKITATVASTAAGTFTNWAEISASDQVDIDSVPGNNSTNTDDDASAPSADLRVEQTVSNVYPGWYTDFTFEITVTNDGTVGATGVQVRDKLPSGLSFKSSSVPASSYNASTGIWTVGTLATGASATLTITAQITRSGVFTNWAEVYAVTPATDPDSTPANSSTTEDDDASARVYYKPVFINEVAWAGTSSSLPNDQWIELYNPSSVAVDITGWTITAYNSTFKITLSGSIPAGGYFLLERDDDRTVSDIRANQIYTGSQTSTAALSTSGETLYLFDADSPTPHRIDTANFAGLNKPNNPWPAGGMAPNYPTMERQGTTGESDSVWITNTGVTKNGKNASGGLIYGTPGKKNSTGVQPTPTRLPPTPTKIPPVVRPIINEFLARPGFDWNQDGSVDVFDEFIEIKNIGVVDVDLTDWQLDDEEEGGSLAYYLPDITLKPGQRVVFYGLETNILLSDGGDTVRLIDPNGKIYDAYTYSLVRTEDQSVCRLPDGNGSWYEDCIPSPSLTNTREGVVPSMPGGDAFESPFCELPDTLPPDFLFAECRGYGANIWYSFYWDQFGWQGDQHVPENTSKWDSFVE